MGLDMWLTRAIYVGGEYEHNGISGTLCIKKNGVKLPIRLNRTSTITEHVAYWRKANHIHKWFVDNVQNGNDNCGQYEVPIEKLQLLVDICNRVLKDHKLADELLPTEHGSFFGSYEYSDYYYTQLEETVRQIKPIIKEIKQIQEMDKYIPVTVLYESSW